MIILQGINPDHPWLKIRQSIILPLSIHELIVLNHMIYCFPQGGAVLAVVFAEDTQLPPDVEFFLVFEGSSERHVTTARCIRRNKLSACIPGVSSHPSSSILVLLFIEREKTKLLLPS